MLSPRALRWLHRVGYVTTAIVTLEAAGLAAALTYGLVRAHRQAVVERDATRTHAGPLAAYLGDLRFELGDISYLLSRLPALRSLGSDAFRFVAMPSFGRQWFAVAMRANGADAVGVLVTMPRQSDGRLGPEARRGFSMPLAAFRAIMARADQLSDGWSGDDGLWLDGTDVAFERVRGPSVTSGHGNSGTHYGKLAIVLRDGLAPYLPEAAGLDGEWMPQEDRQAR